MCLNLDYAFNILGCVSGSRDHFMSHGHIQYVLDVIIVRDVANHLIYLQVEKIIIAISTKVVMLTVIWAHFTTLS